MTWEPPANLPLRSTHPATNEALQPSRAGCGGWHERVWACDVAMTNAPVRTTPAPRRDRRLPAIRRLLDHARDRRNTAQQHDDAPAEGDGGRRDGNALGDRAQRHPEQRELQP